MVPLIPYVRDGPVLLGPGRRDEPLTPVRTGRTRPRSGRCGPAPVDSRTYETDFLTGLSVSVVSR